jgi:hypothetical protein
MANRPLFTEEELADMRLADEEIEKHFVLSVEDLTLSQSLDKQAKLDCADAKQAKKIEYYREYKKNNADSLSRKKASWYQKNRERIRAKQAAYYLENREAILERKAAYRKLKQKSCSRCARPRATKEVEPNQVLLQE